MRKHSPYSRNVIDGEWAGTIWVHRFRCRECGRTVSFLPSFAVPYKQFSSRIIGWYLHAILWLLTGIRQTLRDNPFGVTRGSVQNWLRQWHANRVTLLQEGVRRLGVALTAGVTGGSDSPWVTGETMAAYRACCAYVYRTDIPAAVMSCAQTVLPAVQPALCQAHPPLGLFRPLLLPMAA